MTPSKEVSLPVNFGTVEHLQDVDGVRAGVLHDGVSKEQSTSSEVGRDKTTSLVGFAERLLLHHLESCVDAGRKPRPPIWMRSGVSV